MAGYSPFMRSVVCTTAGTIYQLSVLITAIDANVPLRAGMIILELDTASTGNLYIGNSAVSPTNCGANILPGGSWTADPDMDGLLLATDIYLRSSVSLAQVDVTYLPKGQ